MKVLSTVPFDVGFHFFLESKGYTGITATSLSELANKLQTIELQSITYHFGRHDFQNWIENTIGDAQLARRIDQLKEGSIREELIITIQKHINQLNLQI